MHSPPKQLFFYTTISIPSDADQTTRGVNYHHGWRPAFASQISKTPRDRCEQPSTTILELKCHCIVNTPERIPQWHPTFFSSSEHMLCFIHDSFKEARSCMKRNAFSHMGIRTTAGTLFGSHCHSPKKGTFLRTLSP